METKEERKSCVYMHVNKINGKKYIGWTSRLPEERWKKDGYEYTRTDKNGNYKHRHFGPAINLYGWDNFEHKIIYDSLTEEEAKEKEKELIARYDTTNPEKGYNLTLGGDGTVGYQHTNEAKAKMSKAKQGKKPWNYGISPTEETLKKLRESHIGYKPSAEQLEKLSKSMTEWWSKEENRLRMSGENHHNYGTKFSEETKRKISESQKGKIIPLETIVKAANARVGLTQSEETKQKIQKNNQNKRAVLQFSLDGKFIAEYVSTREAEKYTGVKYQYIIACCKHQKQEAGGFIWEYKEKRNDDHIKTCSHRANIPVVQLTLQGEFIAEYKSAAEVGRINNMDRSTIVRCCKGRQKTAGGYRWMYAENYYKTIQND